MKAAEQTIREIEIFARSRKEERPGSGEKEYVACVNDTVKEERFRTLYYSAFDGKLKFFISKLDVKKYIDLFGITAEE